MMNNAWVSPVNTEKQDLLAAVNGCSGFWFALFTRSNHEKKVAAYLVERQLENYLPLYSVDRQWSNNRKVRVDIPLFPGYLFVRLKDKERLRALSAPGAISLVGQGGAPTPIPDCEIDVLRSGLMHQKFEPYPYLKVGTRVRVRTGALAGMVGVIVRHKSSYRIVLSIDLIQQSVALEIDNGDVEPLPAISFNT